MTDPVPPIDVWGAVGWAVVVTVVVNPLLSLLVLARYRAAVKRSMHVAAAATARGTPGPGPAPGAPWPGPVPPGRPGGARLQVLPPGPRIPPGPLTALAVARVRRTVAGYVTAGLAAALTGAVVLALLDGSGIDPLRVAVTTVLYAWPIVPAVVVVAAPGRSATASLVAGYAVVLLGLGVVGLPGGVAGAVGVLTAWGVFAGSASLVLAAVAARPLRAVGPFLAPSLLVVGVGLATWGWLALPIVFAGANAVTARVLAGVIVVVVAACGLAVVPLAAWRHRRKAASDQSILLDQWWLIFFLVQVVWLLDRGVAAAALLLPYVVYRVVVGLARRGDRRHVTGPPVQLLLLRVFGSRGRSEALLRDVGAYWRHVGSVELIAGTDLASENLEPHEFLDFATGRLARQFVTGEADLRERLGRLDLRPDDDGRFRVNEFFCHDDTWRPTLHALVHAADVILVDLRGLGPRRRGVVYEIHQLVALRLLDRVVALVDDTTDLGFLQQTLDRAGAPWLCAVAVRGRRAAAVEVMDHLDAAARPAGRRVAYPAS